MSVLTNRCVCVCTCTRVYFKSYVVASSDAPVARNPINSGASGKRNRCRNTKCENCKKRKRTRRFVRNATTSRSRAKQILAFAIETFHRGTITTRAIDSNFLMDSRVFVRSRARLENSWSNPASKSCRADGQNAHKITDTGEQSKIYWPFGGTTIRYRLHPRRLIFGCVMAVAFLPFRTVMIHFMSALILSG